MRKRRGFTLIELLVVIAIIAILSIVIVLTLNPAEILRRSRDSNRVSDLAVIRTSIGLYLAQVSTTNMGPPNWCFTNLATTTMWGKASSTGVATSVSNCNYWFNLAPINVATNTSRSVASSGWIPINLSSIVAGSPIGQWPADPVNSAGTASTSLGYFYSYTAGVSNNAYKLAAKMESTLYSASGTNDMESADGGTDPYIYETGSDLTL